jgi:urease accessory protein
MQLISGPVQTPDARLPQIALRVDRFTAAKRLWRAVADDGTEFGFELNAPLRHGTTFWQTTAARYVLQQDPEPVVEISLAMPPSAAAGIGWAVGNLHLELCAEPERLLAPDEPAVRALLARLDVAFTPTTAVFRSGRFARGGAAATPPHELGHSHQH